MRELRTEIDIRATAEDIWKILMDFERFPEWNPFVRSITGEAKGGAGLKVRIEPEGGMGMTMTPMVIAAVETKKFAWKGKLLFAGLFDGQHEFILEDEGDGRTKFVHREEFSGILVPILWPMLEKNTTRGFNDMNAALKKRAEGN